MKTAIDLRNASIFDLSDEELNERLRPAAEAMVTEKWAKGGYMTYYDRLICPTTSHFIHEYADRKELVQMDANGQEHFVKLLY